MVTICSYDRRHNHLKNFITLIHNNFVGLRLFAKELLKVGVYLVILNFMRIKGKETFCKNDLFIKHFSNLMVDINQRVGNM